MKHDQPLLASLLTLSGWPIGEIITQVLKHYELTTLSALDSMSLMWVKEPSWALGVLGAIGFNFWLTMIIYYSTKVWGTDYFPLKAMVLTMTSESLLFNIFGILGKNELLIQNVSGNFVHAATAGMGGFFSGYLLKKFLFKVKLSKERS